MCNKAIEDGWQSSQLTKASLFTEYGDEESQKIGFEIYNNLSQQNPKFFKSRHGYDGLALAKIFQSGVLL